MSGASSLLAIAHCGHGEGARVDAYSYEDLHAVQPRAYGWTGLCTLASAAPSQQWVRASLRVCTLTSVARWPQWDRIAHHGLQPTSPHHMMAAAPLESPKRRSAAPEGHAARTSSPSWPPTGPTRPAGHCSPPPYATGLSASSPAVTM